MIAYVNIVGAHMTSGAHLMDSVSEHGFITILEVKPTEQVLVVFSSSNRPRQGYARNGKSISR